MLGRVNTVGYEVVIAVYILTIQYQLCLGTTIIILIKIILIIIITKVIVTIDNDNNNDNNK